MAIEDTSTPEAGLGINAAADAIAGLMDPETETPETDDQGAEVPEAEGEEALEEVTGEELEDTEDDPSFSDDDEDEDGGVEEGEEEGDLEDVFAVKVNGEEVEVTLDELLSGYSRTSDYTQKTMDLAEQRKGLDALNGELQTERQQYAQMLPLMAAQLEAGMEQEPDWDSLFQQDPIQASRDQYEWNKRQQAIAERQQAIAAEFQRVTEADRVQKEQERQKLIQDEVARLPDVIPEWADQVVMEKEVNSLREWAAGVGITAEQMDAIESAPVIAALRKAMFFDKGQKRAVKKRTRPSKALKPGSASSKKSRKVSDVTRGKQRLAKTGRINDAANVIGQMLE